MISLPQPGLKQGLAVVFRAVASKSTLPVLSHVQLCTETEQGDDDGSQLRLSATNLAIGLVVWIDATVQHSMAICLPAQLLQDVVGELSAEDEIRIKVDARTMTAEVKGGPFGEADTCRSESNIKGIRVEDFPALPDLDGPAQVTMRSDLLRRAINAVSYAASSDDTRPALCGVSMALWRDKIRFTSADGFRAARYMCVPDEPIGILDPAEECVELLPEATTLRHLASILDATEKPVDVAIRISPKGSQVTFDVPGGAGLARVVLVARLIDGKFPDFDRLLPTEHTTRVIAKAAPMRSGVKFVGLVALTGERTVRLLFTPDSETGPGSIAISANAVEIGKNAASVDAMIHGVVTMTSVNVRFLAEVLGVIKTDEVAIDLRTGDLPLLLSPVGDAGELHLLMPMVTR